MRTLLAILMLPLLAACGTKTPLKLPPTTTAQVAHDTVVSKVRENLFRAASPSITVRGVFFARLPGSALASSKPIFLHRNHNNNVAEPAQCA